MNVEKQADQIALLTVRANTRYGLRGPPAGEVEERTANCLDNLTTFLKHELSASEMADYAASVTYRANYYQARAASLDDRYVSLLKAIQIAEDGSIGDTRAARAALKKLGETNNWMISNAVAFGQTIDRKISASNSGTKGKLKFRELEAFAMELFDQKSDWKSVLRARDVLWPKVQAEAARRKVPFSPDTGPRTLYGWLLEHVKVTRQLVDIHR